MSTFDLVPHTWTNGTFNFAGSTAIDVHAGYEYGVRVWGGNNDSNSFINGTVVLTNFDAPETACPGDLDGSGDVGFTDLVQLLALWGPCTCAEDLDGSGDVGFTDLVQVLSAWGPCP